jgi:formylmethanofuran dehydrogenase subunit A
MLRITNGQVHDPANGLRGEVRDVIIDGGRIVSAEGLPQAQLDEMETIDATGCVVMPGGVDIHSHIAGTKVNNGRILCPEEHGSHVSARTPITRAGCGLCVPTTHRTGYLYSMLGYTTAFEAAVPPLEARHAHEELQDLPMLDKGCYTVMGNNHLVMKVLSDTDPVRRKERLRELVSWLLKASRGYTVKIVNPGGVEDWKWGMGAADLDTPTPPFGVTPRQIISALAETTPYTCTATTWASPATWPPRWRPCATWKGTGPTSPTCSSTPTARRPRADSPRARRRWPSTSTGTPSSPATWARSSSARP